MAHDAIAGMATEWDLRTILHDVRTPLNSILLWVRLLKDGRTEPAEKTRALEVIENSGLAIAKSVEDLAVLSRIERQPLDFRELVSSAIAAERILSGERGVRIEDVPAGPPVIVRADPVRLREAARALIAHAADGIPPGGVVRVEFEVQGASVTLRTSGFGTPAGESRAGGVREEPFCWTLGLPLNGSP